MGDGPAPRGRSDPQFAARRMGGTVPEKMILVALEIVQHVVPAPAGKAELAPMVVVRRLAAHVDHGIDGGRAADHFAARISEAAAVEPPLRLGAKTPLRPRVADRAQTAPRDVKPHPSDP